MPKAPVTGDHVDRLTDETTGLDLLFHSLLLKIVDTHPCSLHVFKTEAVTSDEA